MFGGRDIDPITETKERTYVRGEYSSFEEQALDEIKDYQTKCENQRRPYILQIESNYRQWRGIYDSRDKEDNEKDRTSIKSRIFIKMTQEIVATAHAAIMKTTWPDEYFDVEPSLDEQLNPTVDEKTKALYLKETIRNLHRLDKRKKKVSQFVKAMCIHGTAIAKVYPKSITKSKFVLTPQIAFNEENNPYPVQVPSTSSTTVTRPSFENIDIRNFYIDLYADDVQTAKGLIIRSVVSKQHLLEKQKEGVYKNIDDLEEKKTEGERDSKRERFQSLGFNVEGEEGVELWEYWGTIGDDTTEYLITVANGDTLIRNEKNQSIGQRKRPILIGSYDDDPGIIYGIGIPEKVAGSQAALNALWRAKIDNFAQANNVEAEVDVTKIYDLEKEDFKRYSGKTWLFRGPNGIKWHQPEMITNDSYEIQALERYIQEESGVPKLLGGQATKQERQSAFEIDTTMKNVSMIFENIQANIEQDVIIPMVELDYEQLIMYMNDEEIIRLAGANGSQIIKSVGLEDIFGNYAFKATGSSIAAAKNTLNQQLLQFMQVAQGARQLDPGINRQELYKRILENLGVKGIGTIINVQQQIPIDMVMAFLQQTNPQLMQMFQMYMQKLQQMQGQPQGSPQAPQGQMIPQNGGMQGAG